jgi:hypothetical protein
MSDTSTDDAPSPETHPSGLALVSASNGQLPLPFDHLGQSPTKIQTGADAATQRLTERSSARVLRRARQHRGQIRRQQPFSHPSACTGTEGWEPDLCDCLSAPSLWSQVSGHPN